jgi:PhoH-like ATPase
MPSTKVVLVTKDINMRLKARACGLAAEDYHNDQLVSDDQATAPKRLSRHCRVVLGPRGGKVDTVQGHGPRTHCIMCHAELH